uniref:Immunoglobulin C1-set domain-containing protein n=1 Tax=Phasianus colchicus TaxID=9054 RepID=A0A669P0T3_PHACC
TALQLQPPCIQGTAFLCRRRGERHRLQLRAVRCWHGSGLEPGRLSAEKAVAVNGSETDFTIHIRDVRLEDAGTYYCVKFRRNTSGDEVFKSGGGTKVLVHGEWIPSLSWWALLWGWDGGFFPRDIQVQWLKNSVPVQAELPRITSEPSNSSYNMSSTVQVTLHKNDVRSELTCQVQHSTLSVRALRLPGECTSLCFASDLPPIYSIT